MASEEKHTRPNKSPQEWRKWLVVFGLVLLGTYWGANTFFRKRPNPSDRQVSHQAFAPLVGKWQRSDGPYVLDIQEVNESGTLIATYLNPKSIHISKALAREKNGQPEVFILLMDKQYPGCTYTLTYDKENDRLVGTYYQAKLDQTYSVIFVRVVEKQGK